MRLDPFSPLYRSMPAATWRRLLEAPERVGFDKRLGLWLIVGHDAVRTALADWSNFANAATLAPVCPVSQQVIDIVAANPLPSTTVDADPPVHPRTRAALNAVWPNTPNRVQDRWGALVQAQVDRHIDQLVTALDGGDVVDLVEAFTRALPLAVISDVLGLPDGDQGKIVDWSDGQLELIWGDPVEAAQIRAAEGTVAMRAYCRDLARARNAARAGASGPAAGSIVDDLLTYRGGNDARLTLDEVAGLVLSLAVAGWETTAGLLAHSFERGVTDPARWARLARDAEYAARHVEETLRHSPPIDGWLRLTTRAVTLAGVDIPAGARCLLLIGTANRDPGVHTSPDVFDPDRPLIGNHLAFGAGSHYCIGAGLARLEAVEALGELARRLPDLALATSYHRHYHPSVAVRRHTSLPVSRTGRTRCPVQPAVVASAAQPDPAPPDEDRRTEAQP